MVPVKYTTEINFELESPTRKFTETIDLQVIIMTIILVYFLLRFKFRRILYKVNIFFMESLYSIFF